MNWPIGSGREFRGVVSVRDRQVELYEKASGGGSLVPRTTRLPLSQAEVGDAITGEACSLTTGVPIAVR